MEGGIRADLLVHSIGHAGLRKMRTWKKCETGEAAQHFWKSRWQGGNPTGLGERGPLVIVVNWSEGNPARRRIQGKRARRGKFFHDEICRERISIERRKLEGGTLENLARGVPSQRSALEKKERSFLKKLPTLAKLSLRDPCCKIHHPSQNF
jgi:hypothetical protein